MDAPKDKPAPRKPWTPPRLHKIGTIADVAGNARVSLTQIPSVFRS